MSHSHEPWDLYISPPSSLLNSDKEVSVYLSITVEGKETVFYKNVQHLFEAFVILANYFI